MLHIIEVNNTRMEIEQSILETEELISRTKQLLLRVDKLLVKLHHEVDLSEAVPPARSADRGR